MDRAELILSFDTATQYCSIALTEGTMESGTVVAALSLDSGISHSKRLLESINWLLRTAGLSLDEISAIGVGLGPGSFTGLRIGMATAKGLCHGSGKPLIGISSLDAIGCALSSDKLIGAVLDARKKEVYACFYRLNSESFPKRCSEPVVMEPQRLAEQIEEEVVLAGEGAIVHHAVFQAVLGSKLEIGQRRHRYPAAEVIGFLAASSYRGGQFLDLGTAVPAYVRTSDAELSLVRSSGKDARIPSDNR